MKELYIQYNKLLNKIDRDICKNKYIALKYLKSEPAKKEIYNMADLKTEKNRTGQAAVFSGKQDLIKVKLKQ